MRVWRGIFRGISAVVLSITVVLAFAAVVIPTFTGAQTYTVLTRSMEPAYPPGTYLVVRPTPVDELKLGDIITYQLKSGQPEVVTHRITGVSTNSDGERRFTTQGDNNAVADPEQVRPVQIRGALWYAIPYLGWLTGLRGESSSSVWIPIAAGLVFLYAAYMVVAWIIERRKTRAADAEQPEHDTAPEGPADPLPGSDDSKL
ncbi:signal peptidase I [Leucobacter insecticola]|uniref:Signal peptidase I n=2 Tax=Leucobacter insecticola TaxID=2714934 RepID=A0A6G8FLT3_9MICO|nr:signal peptidase I [Leucobacter insecticola]